MTESQIHFFRNKLAIVEGVINDTVNGLPLSKEDLVDGQEAVAALVAMIDEMKEFPKK